ncbi:MAG: hypothetical protein U1E73_10385 [Planctomycetota bacterium]
MDALRSTLIAVLSATAAIAQDSFSVNSGTGSSGLICAPWSCTPTALAAARGFPLGLVVAGSGPEPRVLLLSVQPPVCLPVPGIGGALQVQQPIVLFQDFLWGHIYVNSGPLPNTCSGWMGFGRLPWPSTLPAGFRVVAQTLSFHTANGIGLSAFSNAVEITAL